MQVQISIIGIFLILAFYVVGAGLLAALWKTLPAGRGRLAISASLAALLLILPVADEAWITWHFNDLCKDAGVHITRKVEVDGFYDDTMRSGYELVERYGYKFMEHRSDKRDKVEHVEKVDGQWRKTIYDRPSARYHYKHADPLQDVPVGFKTKKSEEVVLDTQTGEIIGRDTRYKRYPGWVEGLWIRFFGSGLTICPDPGKGPPREHLPVAAVKPLKQQ